MDSKIIADIVNHKQETLIEYAGRVDQKEVVSVLKRCLKIVYSSFLHETLDTSFVRITWEMLKEQIERALPLTHSRISASSERAEAITDIFFSQLNEVADVLATDMNAIYEGDPAASSVDEVLITYPGFYAISIYRLAHLLYMENVPMIPRIMTEHAHSRTGIDINAGATIGHRFFIDHGTGIVIGETTIIGENVKLYQGVTLGALSTRGGQSLAGTKRHPTIMDNVTVYAGASVLGNVVIGENSVLGSNVFVTSDIPANTKVILKNQEHKIVTF